MSSDNKTHLAILEAARKLLEERGGEHVRLADVAKEAGVSRQAVYLHFGSRGRLFVELVQHIDEVHGLEDLMYEVQTSESGVVALDRFVELWANYVPHIHSAAQAMQAARVHDAQADAAWKDRMALFRIGCQEITERLASEGCLAKPWSPTTAAEMMWAFLSIQTWQDLTVDCQWSTQQYAKRMCFSLHRILVRDR